MTGALATLFRPVLGAPGVVAQFSLDDWWLVAFFLIAGLIRLVEMLRNRGKQAPPAPPAETPPLPRPRPSPPEDPWRRAPTPVASPPARPAPRPVVHDVEGPERTLVNLEGWKPHEFESERKAKGKGKPKAAPKLPTPDARPVAGRALLVGTLPTTRDRMRSAVAWKEVLDRPRRLRLRRPPSGP